MNNKGFTLIELLASVALIAIISLIITPTITSTIKNNKIKSCEKTFDSIQEAAKTYVSDNRYNIINAFSGCTATNLSSTGCSITAAELKTKKYITGELKNPLTKDSLGSVEVTVKLGTNKRYTYTLSPTSANTCK